MICTVCFYSASSVSRAARPAPATPLGSPLVRLWLLGTKGPTDEVLTLLKGGMGATEVARKLKIGRASVYRILESATAKSEQHRKGPGNSRLCNKDPVIGVIGVRRVDRVNS